MPTQSRFRSIDLRTDALDALMDRLNRLKDHNGQMQGDSLWLDDNEPRFLTLNQVTSTNGSTPAVINITLASTQRMKSTLAALRTITASLEDVVSTVQVNTRSALRYHGMNSIPTEVLSRILGYACDPTTLQHLEVSYICRRFREVAVNLPQLWTFIAPRQSLEWRNLQLSRSGNSPLIIDFSTHGRPKPAQPTNVQTTSARRVGYGFNHGYIYDGTCTCTDYLAVVVKYVHRWRSFTFTVTHSGTLQKQVKLEIQNLLTGLQRLPCLEHLSISKECTKAGDSRALLLWKTPILQNLQCCQDLGLLLSTLDSGSYITSLALTLAELQRGDNSHLSTLSLLFLPKSVAVDHLSLKFDSPLATTNGNAAMDAKEGIPKCLPFLRTLSIDFSFSIYKDIFNKILAHIQLPILSELSVSFDPYYYGDEDRNRYFIESDLEELMEVYESFLNWLAQPIAVFRKQFASLKLLRIKVIGHKEADEDTLDNEMRARLHSGWGLDLEYSSGDASPPGDYDHNAPEIQMTFKARPPPTDDY